MRIILILFITLLLNSCFKTSEQIRREKMVDNMEVQLKQSSKVIADLTAKIQTLQDSQIQASGKLDEIDHKNETAKVEFQTNVTSSLAAINEQLLLLQERDKEREKQYSALNKEVSKLKKYISKVTGTLTEITGPTVHSSNDKLKQAHAAFEKNKQKLATKLYKECLQENKVNAAQKNHILFNLGLMSFWNKRYDEALVSFSKIYTKYPKSRLAPRSLLYIARSFKKQGKKDEALATFAELIQKYPKSSQAKRAKKEMKN